MFPTDLLCGWAAYWTFYWTVGYAMPRFAAKTRKIAKVTENKVLYAVLRDMVFTFCMIPIYDLVPKWGWRSGAWYEYILTNITMRVILEVVNYHVHRFLLHHSFLRSHHDSHHAFIESKPLASRFVSVVEMVLENPFHLMPFCRMLDCGPGQIMLLYTAACALIIRSHSGVMFNVKPKPGWKDWFLRTVLWDGHHAVHHATSNMNYGYLSVLDKLYGTYVEPDIAFSNIEYNEVAVISNSLFV